MTFEVNINSNEEIVIQQLRNNVITNNICGTIKLEVNTVSNRKADPSTIGLGSTDVQGQGTTMKETGNKKADSSRKKQKRS